MEAAGLPSARRASNARFGLRMLTLGRQRRLPFPVRQMGRLASSKYYAGTTQAMDARLS